MEPIYEHVHVSVKGAETKERGGRLHTRGMVAKRDLLVERQDKVTLEVQQYGTIARRINISLVHKLQHHSTKKITYLTAF